MRSLLSFTLCFSCYPAEESGTRENFRVIMRLLKTRLYAHQFRSTMYYRISSIVRQSCSFRVGLPAHQEFYHLSSRLRKFRHFLKRKIDVRYARLRSLFAGLNGALYVYITGRGKGVQNWYSNFFASLFGDAGDWFSRYALGFPHITSSCQRRNRVFQKFQRKRFVTLFIVRKKSDLNSWQE